MVVFRFQSCTGSINWFSGSGERTSTEDLLGISPDFSEKEIIESHMLERKAFVCTVPLNLGFLLRVLVSSYCLSPRLVVGYYEESMKVKKAYSCGWFGLFVDVRVTSFGGRGSSTIGDQFPLGLCLHSHPLQTPQNRTIQQQFFTHTHNASEHDDSPTVPPQVHW
jgi:hypothetical protein